MSLKKKKKHQEEEMGEAWLLPYSDLMTLLLAVFIVLFAVSQVDEQKTAAMAEAFRSSMLTGGDGVLENDGSSVLPLYPDGSDGEYQLSEGSDTTSSQEETQDIIAQNELDNLGKIKSNLDTLFDEEGVNTYVTTQIDERGLVVSLDNAILFDSGSADIKPDNEDTLIQIANTINSLDNYIRIEGHTDNIPISTSLYPSNWELSSARASSVVRLFVNKCNIDPKKMVAVGYGEFKPVADNSTEEGRAQNRRIDIIILSQQYNSLEDQVSDVQKIQE